jgi:N utilization substance protein B
MLFQIDVTAATPEEVFPQFWAAQDTGDDVRSFAESLVLGVTSRRRSLDAVMAASSDHWRVERMAVVDRNVLRMAVFELLCHRDTPPAVVLDEAIEVAKRFGGDESGAFVNGVLDAVRRSLDRGEIPIPPAD